MCPFSRTIIPIVRSFFLVQMLTADIQNRLQEALTIFDSVCNSQWFLKTSIMLFLNVDGLQEKLRVTPLAGEFIFLFFLVSAFPVSA